jgi:hypothetical protein
VRLEGLGQLKKKIIHLIGSRTCKTISPPDTLSYSSLSCKTRQSILQQKQILLFSSYLHLETWITPTLVQIVHWGHPTIHLIAYECTKRGISWPMSTAMCSTCLRASGGTTAAFPFNYEHATVMSSFGLEPETAWLAGSSRLFLYNSIDLPTAWYIATASTSLALLFFFSCFSFSPIQVCSWWGVIKKKRTEK